MDISHYFLEFEYCPFQHLADPCHTVRSASLKLIGCLGSTDHKQSNGTAVDLQSLLADFSHDQDPRVRTSAFHALVRTTNKQKNTIRMKQNIYYTHLCIGENKIHIKGHYTPIVQWLSHQLMG